mmetsp:Transcript_49037/g.88654  ORF Transcript_49037/g.88654 Transcript_49037/m.88654 type:complete len:206 (+) Transcript_49037:150-767(+)
MRSRGKLLKCASCWRRRDSSCLGCWRSRRPATEPTEPRSARPSSTSVGSPWTPPGSSRRKPSSESSRRCAARRRCGGSASRGCARSAKSGSSLSVSGNCVSARVFGRKRLPSAGGRPWRERRLRPGFLSCKRERLRKRCRAACTAPTARAPSTTRRLTTTSRSMDQPARNQAFRLTWEERCPRRQHRLLLSFRRRKFAASLRRPR